jgi:hypothetical protein
MPEQFLTVLVGPDVLPQQVLILMPLVGSGPLPEQVLMPLVGPDSLTEPELLPVQVLMHLQIPCFLFKLTIIIHNYLDYFHFLNS